MADERYPRMAWQAKTQGKRSKYMSGQFWEEGVQKFVMKEELSG
jgi:hypothetical protein